MTLLEQCQIWNEKDEYQKIIDTIEAIPEESRTPELCSELARAYNNAADVDDKEMYEKALSLLLPYEEQDVYKRQLLLAAVLFSVGIGLGSGYYPANKAVQISALEAIKTS